MTTRRSFLKSMGQMIALASIPFASARALNPRILIVGGGVAGTRAAAYLKMSLPAAEVTLFDPSLNQYTGDRYFSVQSGYKPVPTAVLDDIDVRIVSHPVSQLDPVSKTVALTNGRYYRGDFIVVAPGVDFKWQDFNGYTAGLEHSLIHAWSHPNGEQELWRRIENMDNGEIVAISVPKAPYRFSMGPYERATRFAHYIKSFKPASKVMILDANDSFPSMHKFMNLWQGEFPAGMIEWVKASDGGLIDRVDTSTNTIYTNTTEIRTAVLNVIPPQQAGQIARKAALNHSHDWCQVDSRNLKSTHYQDVYILGDANDASPNHKTAAVAQQHALLCANAIKASLV